MPDEPWRQRGVRFPHSEDEYVQRVADAETEGNFSMAARKLIAEARRAREAQQNTQGAP